MDGPVLLAKGAFRRRLLDWYLLSKRDLPWRRTRDPYAIWVSEVMLQQTRIDVVKDAFVRFLARFPDPATLAGASDDELLSVWGGLGYSRRARLLRDGARSVVAEHAGRVPSDPQAFGSLPGVGPYTLGAVLSIAFDLPLPALDANVERVLCRVLHVTENPRVSAVRRRLTTALSELIPGDGAGDFNQALMELGALVCKPAVPQCHRCPVRELCGAFTAGDAGLLPALPPRPESLRVATEVALVRRGGEVLAIRARKGRVNEGYLDLPGLGVPLPVVQPDGTSRPLEDEVARWLDPPVKLSPATISVSHTITRHRITIAVREGEAATGRAREEALFVHPDDASLPWSTVARKVFRERKRPRTRTLLF